MMSEKKQVVVHSGKKRYKISFDREGCIGAAACAAVNPDFWKIVKDGKAELKDAKKLDENRTQELEIEEKDFKKNLESAEACPVNVIHIIDLETGEHLI